MQPSVDYNSLTVVPKYSKLV